MEIEQAIKFSKDLNNTAQMINLETHKEGSIDLVVVKTIIESLKKRCERILGDK